MLLFKKALAILLTAILILSGISTVIAADEEVIPISKEETIPGEILVVLKEAYTGENPAELFPELDIAGIVDVYEQIPDCDKAGTAYVITLADEDRANVYSATILLHKNEYIKYAQPNYDYNIVYGDLNNDGQVDLADLMYMRRYLAGGDVKINLDAADFFFNGVIDLGNLMYLRRYLVGGSWWDVNPQPVNYRITPGLLSIELKEQYTGSNPVELFPELENIGSISLSINNTYVAITLTPQNSANVLFAIELLKQNQYVKRIADPINY